MRAIGTTSNPYRDATPSTSISDLGAIKTDLAFITERLSKLPTRKELALRPL
jgi:hypothetical protein